MFTPVTSNPDPKSAGLDVLGSRFWGSTSATDGSMSTIQKQGQKGWFLSTESHFDKQTAEGATSRSNGLENNEHQALGAVECEDGSY